MIWVLVVCCWLVSFIFSGIESGILSVNRVRLRHRVKAGDAAALELQRLLKDPERLLVTVLVVTNLMNILAVILATQELVRHWGWEAYPAAFAMFLPVHLLLLEVLPKSLFRRMPYRALTTLALPLRLADLALAPMHFVGWRLSRRIFGEKPSPQQKLHTAREDFKYLTFESERMGTLPRAEREMIHNIIDFRSVTARQVMVPMDKVAVAPGSASTAQVVAQSLESGFERMPVRSESGAFTGLIDVFDLVIDSDREEAVEAFQRRLVKVAPNEPAYAVLRKLRAARVPMALVVEGGQPVGLVTSEDIVRRLVDPAQGKVEGAARR